MLDYESQCFLEAIQESELMVFGKGVLTEVIMTNLLKAYTTETSLVFVLGATKGEEVFFKERLGNEKVYSITSEEYNANDRKLMYLNGGVFFITSRILVMDLLKEIFPIDKITGIVLLRAHNVVENSQEAFILRLYRTKNKTGFIKALSTNPGSFLLGYSKLSRVMRSCFLANVTLWPRFHQLVKDSLHVPDAEDGDSGVAELQLNLSDEMKEIQTNLLDLVSWSVSELKRLVPALNDDEINGETALTEGFQKIVGGIMDAEWNTVSNKAKELINDIKVFRTLLKSLTKSDCVTFYSELGKFTSPEVAFKTAWVLSPSADTIIVAAKNRLMRLPKRKKNESGVEPKSTKRVFRPEVHPKWLAVGEILHDIFVKNGNRGLNDESEPVEGEKAPRDFKTLIFVEDQKTCNVLRDYLIDGSMETLGKLALSLENVNVDLPADILRKLDYIKRNDKARTAPNTTSKSKSNTDEEQNESSSADVQKDVQITLTQIQRKYEAVKIFPTPVVIKPYKNVGEEEAFAISECLRLIKPDVIIIFDPELELIRQIEIHRARLAPQQNIRVYFLAFRNSVEEQIYLTAIKREKLAFERLIQEKATMVVPEEREGKDELNQDLWRDSTKASEVNRAAQSKRNMEEPTTSEKEVILVDIREFRSELPSLLHKRGVDLEPLTLDVGDYILTPDICVERKSISDLIGSLNTGRLYKQAEAMGRHYKKPVLLIEHERKALSTTYRRSGDLTQIMPKLQVLTMQFPNLRLIWSPGAHYTSEVFQELKKGKEQPNAEAALAIQKEAVGEHISTKYNPVTHSFLSKMPGMDSRNVYAVLNRYSTLQEVSEASEKELEEVLQNSQFAALLYAGLHAENLTKDAAGSSNAKPLIPGKKKPFFRMPKKK